MSRGDFLSKTIGQAPLIGVRGIVAKAEFLNPSGSIKDRMAWYMVRKAEERGQLQPGFTIVEATSGNTGISFAMVAAAKGYRVVAVMPEDMSRERRQLMEAFGAMVILTPAENGPRGAIERKDQLASEHPNAWVPDQFENADNVAAHRETTGKEILEQAGSDIGAFVAGVGTGGTLMGVGEALRKINPKVKIIAVEPAESAVLSGERAGQHKIQGIGEGFVPKLVDLDIIDEVERISSQEAIEMTKQLVREEALPVGISSGANILASLKVARKLGRAKKVVTVLPDHMNRYLSLGIFE